MEYLFKGVDIETNKWVKGHLYWDNSKMAKIVDMATDTIYTVFEESVAMYVGIKGKNGEQIFHKDIVKYNDRVCTVGYNEDQCKFSLYYEGFEISGLNASTGPWLEVVGTVYDVLCGR